jgi:hypothetical protein
MKRVPGGYQTQIAYLSSLDAAVVPSHFPSRIKRDWQATCSRTDFTMPPSPTPAKAPFWGFGLGGLADAPTY